MQIWIRNRCGIICPIIRHSQVMRPNLITTLNDFTTLTFSVLMPSYLARYNALSCLPQVFNLQVTPDKIIFFRLMLCSDQWIIKAFFDWSFSWYSLKFILNCGKIKLVRRYWKRKKMFKHVFLFIEQ